MNENKNKRSEKKGTGKKPQTSRSSKSNRSGKKDDNQSQRKANSNEQLHSNNGKRNGNENRGERSSRKDRNGGRTQYPDHASIDECLKRYTSNDSKLVRGKVRTLPGGGMAFVSCDRGSYGKDVLIDGELGRNRAIDGDLVFIEIIGPVSERGKAVQNDGNENAKKEQTQKISVKDFMKKMTLMDDDVADASRKENAQKDQTSTIENEADGMQYEDYDVDEESVSSQRDEGQTWQDDEIQCNLWNPVVSIRKRKNNGQDSTSSAEDDEQFYGRVIHVVPPKASSGKQGSELNPSDESFLVLKSRRTIVGTIAKAPGHNSNHYLFVPNSRCLPRFMVPPGSRPQNGQNEGQLYKADYVYGSWSTSDKWPPCSNVKAMGQSANVEDETQALLIEFGVDHGDFSPEVLKEVEKSVKSGRFEVEGSSDLGWKPTPEMYIGRKDYRKERIFTIDPTTAKDLDDALHIKQLPDGRVEIGVHIADVSHFIPYGSYVDEEAARRTTTVYLVDRVIPMLPRPLCEIACSLNENVERLAFSCVWTMNMDGTMAKKLSKGKASKEDDVWYGRTVIKSCSRLDYSTAQNIIDRKVAKGEKEADPTYWPKSRQPTGGHTIDEVAADVRLMHKVAMARRALRFQNGALGLNGIKLSFQMDDDGKTPSLCEPYPIRDSNRLIEEYMLMANFLVAQRLITHAGGLSVLRQHKPPTKVGLQSVIDIAAESGFEIDGTTSQSLQESLNRMGRECNDELTMQCTTELIMTPMRPAEYFAAGQFEAIDWAHFALNIPYYTHFTSPIRRYPDVLVHRLLQATLDGPKAVAEYNQSEVEIQTICTHCNEKRTASREAQQRSDRVFLSIFLKFNPILSTLGVVLSVGDKAFTVFVPAIGVSGKVLLDEHADVFEGRVIKDEKSSRRSMLLIPKSAEGSKIDIKIFAKLAVSCHCKEDAPIDVKFRIVGVWKER